MKDKVITALKWVGTIIGMIAGAAIFWYVVIEFMWACYYAGIPM